MGMRTRLEHAAIRERTVGPGAWADIHPPQPTGLMSAVQRTRFTGRMAAPPMMAQIPATAYRTP